MEHTCGVWAWTFSHPRDSSKSVPTHLLPRRANFVASQVEPSGKTKVIIVPAWSIGQPGTLKNFIFWFEVVCGSFLCWGWRWRRARRLVVVVVVQLPLVAAVVRDGWSDDDSGGSGIRGGAAATLASSGVSEPVCVGTGGGSAESSGVWYIATRARLAAN